MSQTDVEVIPDLQTDEDEGAIVHIVCCFTYDLPVQYEKTLCGAPIDNDEMPDYETDEDCQKCEIINNFTHYCPMFGTCTE